MPTTTKKPKLASESASAACSQTVLDLGGTLRTDAPDVTLQRARCSFKTIGITRLGNVTGLDHVGIPTWVAVRPLSKSLTVSQGKGLTHELAQVSAAMECIELYHAEEHVPRGHMLNIVSAVEDGNYVHLSDLPIRSDATLSTDCLVEWLEAKDLVSCQTRFIPRQMVSLDFTKPRLACSLFISSSNGLASGNTREEALLHAICELIERDQISFWKVKHDLGLVKCPSRVNLDSINNQHCRFLIERVFSAGLEIAIWDATGRMAVPCFSCSIYDGKRSTLFPMRASGHGCHPVRHIALVRAITEALQSRLTHISGARDDIYWSRYGNDLSLDTDRNKAWVDSLRSEQAESDFRNGPDASDSSTIEILLDFVLTALGREGLEEILIVDLTVEKIGIPVVKVVVPGIEYAAHKHFYTPGYRMQRFLAELGV